MNKKPIFINNLMLCGFCLGTGKDLSEFIGNSDHIEKDCIHCKGEGCRPPTWTEELIYGKGKK